MYAEAAGIARETPVAVAEPEDADDVVTLVRWAHESRTPLVPRGSGSSMAGGAIGAGVVVDLTRLNALGQVDAARRCVWCGPGAVRDAVDAAARRVGLQFTPDPSSGAWATVGGMASTNAAGAHTVRYGATRPWIAALDCVFDDGARLLVRRGERLPNERPAAIDRFLRDVASTLVADERAAPSTHAGVRKDTSGYGTAAYAASSDLVDLLVGSEGTLCLFVGLELRLAPAPAATSSLLGAFPTLEQAVAAAGAATAAGASACELLDRTFLDVAAQGGAAPPLPPATEAVLLAEVEGESLADAARRAREVASAFERAGAARVELALDPRAEHAMWELRHAASPILSRLDPSLRSMQFVEDGAVPPARLPEYVRGVRAILNKHDTRGVIFGHAGDAHVHVNPLVDVRRADWRARVDAILSDVVALTARLGGTLAGEHGDGRLRAPLLPQVWPTAVIARFAAVKRAFDPRGILNPGAKVALAGQRPAPEIKYDPALPPPPAAARAVLDRVERERAYGRSRLAMLDEAIASGREPTRTRPPGTLADDA